MGRFLGRRRGAQERNREEAAGEISGYERASDTGRWRFLRSGNMPGNPAFFRYQREVRLRSSVVRLLYDRRFTDHAGGTYDETMATTPSQSRITVEPGKCGGRPCIRHMRIRVKDVLEMLASGASEDQILTDYPDLEREDIRACLEYAAQYFDHPVFVG